MTFRAGLRAGQVITGSGFTLTGMVSKDRKMMTLTSDAPEVETITPVNYTGITTYDICHRSHSLFRLDLEGSLINRELSHVG